MKKKTIYIIIGVVLGLVLLLYLLSRLPKREFNTFEFPETLVVDNYTTNEKADTIAMVILNKLMGYDTMNVQLYPMPAIFEKDDKMEYVAFIQQVPFQDHKYLIFLQDRASIGKVKMAFSHEMIHLKQYELGHLQTLILDDRHYVWMGDTISGIDVKYEDRPHEIEAQIEGTKLQRKLNKILYKPRK